MPNRVENSLRSAVALKWPTLHFWPIIGPCTIHLVAPNAIANTCAPLPHLLAQPLITLPYMVAIKRQLCGQKLRQPGQVCLELVSFLLLLLFLPWANVNFVILCKGKSQRAIKRHQKRHDESNLMATSSQTILNERRADSSLDSSQQLLFRVILRQHS